MNNLKIEWVDIDKLNPSEYNPRELTEEQEKHLTESIKKFTLLSPIVANKHKGRENIIVSGHQRHMIAVKLGYKKLPVIYVDLDKRREVELNLRFNRDVGQWNLEMLKNFEMDLLLEVGFDNDDLSNIWDDVLQIEDDEFIEEKEIEKAKETKIKIGEMYKLGNHRLLCADSLNPENVKKLMAGEKTSMVYCDPVYNIGLSYNSGIGGKANYGGKTNDKKTDIEYKEFLRKSISNAIEAGNKDLHLFYFCDQRYIGLLQELYASLGIKNQRVCLWIKNGFNVTPQVAFNRSYEPCIYGVLGKPFLFPIKNLNEILNKEIGTGNRTADDIMDIFDIWLAKRLPGQQYEHPTSKPATLHEKPLRRCSKINDIVLDLFAGSGSTMAGCEQLKRRAYMIEIEPVFCQVIVNRFERLTGIKAELIK
jgi:DNA modification methylase